MLGCVLFGVGIDVSTTGLFSAVLNITFELTCEIAMNISFVVKFFMNAAICVWAMARVPRVFG